MLRAILILTMAAISARDALADRPRTDEERTKLATAVAAQGCSGGKMEFDDGKFEAEGVVCDDGKRYELKFDSSFQLVNKEIED
jgi:hypothetical protein